MRAMITSDTVTDPARAFRDALPAHVRHRVYDTGRVAVLVTRAVVEHGWKPEQLAAEASRDLAGVRNAGGVVTYRLERLTEGPPPDRRQPRHVALCDSCRLDGGWSYEDNGNAYRCTHREGDC